jgi:hypothetical protein
MDPTIFASSCSTLTLQMGLLGNPELTYPSKPPFTVTAMSSNFCEILRLNKIYINKVWVSPLRYPGRVLLTTNCRMPRTDRPVAMRSKVVTKFSDCSKRAAAWLCYARKSLSVQLRCTFKLMCTYISLCPDATNRPESQSCGNVLLCFNFVMFTWFMTTRVFGSSQYIRIRSASIVWSAWTHVSVLTCMDAHAYVCNSGDLFNRHVNCRRI